MTKPFSKTNCERLSRRQIANLFRAANPDRPVQVNGVIATVDAALDTAHAPVTPNEYRDYLVAALERGVASSAKG